MSQEENDLINWISSRDLDMKIIYRILVIDLISCITSITFNQDLFAITICGFIVYNKNAAWKYPSLFKFKKQINYTGA